MLWTVLGLITVFSTLKAQDLAPAYQMGWNIGSQAYTFKEFTLAETLDKLGSLNVKYVELYGNQTIGGGIEGTTDFKMSPEKRAKLKALLQSKGIKAQAFGVSSPKTEEEWIQLFEFAKDMGIGVLTSEPDYGHLALIDDLCQKYNIKVAIHNHPIPSKYWHPDIVLNLLSERSSMIGVCADIGHWVRSGLDPVECLKKLEGRVISFHFKDLKDFGIRKTHDVPWGTGWSNVSGVMNEMKRQGFQGPISVEYEHNWLNSVPEVRESLQYFARVAASLQNR